MLIWARESEVSKQLKNSMNRMYGKAFINKFKPWELSIILRQIRRHFGRRKIISILDFGAGISPFAAYLNHIGYQFITCLDKEKGWHRRINQESYNKEYNASVRYIKTDITLNYDGRHDVIFSASVLEHLKDKKRIEVMSALSTHLNPGGLIIHVVDYDEGVNIKKLIDACGISILHNPEETPGCREFKGAPEYAWWIVHKRTRLRSRIAFFNERGAI